MAMQTSLLRFKFDHFENLPSEPGKFIHSETQTDCDGNEWKLELFPGGSGGRCNASHVDANEDEDSTFISLYLCNEGNYDTKLKCSLIMRNASGLEVVETKVAEQIHAGGDTGYREFTKRSFILNRTNGVLVNGALIIDADIQIRRDRNTYHVLPNPFAKQVLNLLESGDRADVAFKIDDTIIPAHKFILDTSAPIIAGFCQGSDIKSPVLIKDTTVKVFRHVLRYVYGGDIPNKKDVLNIGKEIINAADKFDIAGLKMAVETDFVACRVIDVSNVADYLLFAHSKTCPLLKEYAISYFVSRKKDIVNSDSLGKVNESAELLKEPMEAVINNSDSIARTEKTGFRVMGVDTLRKKLEEEDLDIDGSREILVARLESSNASKKRLREE